MAIDITTPDNTLEEREGCASCAACELEAGDRAVCRRNPPNRGPTGAALWPSVNLKTDWCMQWTARPSTKN